MTHVLEQEPRWDVTPLSITVLVVEDEVLLRLNAVAMLEGAGYNTVAAGDADDAIAILLVRNDIRIVFTDIQMPGSMDGLKLAEAIRNRWPAIELIVTSGRSYPRDEHLPERGRFLRKPYSLEQLLEMVEALG